MTFGRVAAWLGFGAAVVAQAALLAGGYLLADGATPSALRDAAIAGCIGLIALAVTILARRAGERAQSRAVDLGHVTLRLVPNAGRSDVGQHRRPAA